MQFEWDEAKNRTNIRKHGFDFTEAEELFHGVVLAYPDVRHDYGENRWAALGFIRGCMAKIVFVEQSPEIIRVISLRKATKSERQEFEKKIKNGLEAD
jgi:hypothetical protein